MQAMLSAPLHLGESLPKRNSRRCNRFGTVYSP